MPEQTSPPDYWFQVRDGAPLGPMTKTLFLEQHGNVPISEIRFCAMGQSDWRPLGEHPDFGGPLSATPSTGTTSPSLPPPPPPAKAHFQPPEWLAVIVGIVLFGLAAYLLYEWARPYTPKEVVERFDKCKTVEEAKALSTPNFYPALVTLYLLDDHSTSGEEYEIVDEGSGTATEHRVSIRGSFFDKTVGRRLPMTAFITLKKSDSWKVDDLSFVSVDGQTFPEPVSLAKNHLLLLQDAQKNQPLGRSTKAPTTTQHWTENKNTQRVGVLALWKFIAAGGAKSVGVVVLAIGGIIYGVIRSRRSATQ